MKKIKIICEKAYEESIWCKQLFGGLIKELKKRRTGYELEEDIFRGDTICIIGVSNRWTEGMIHRCNKKGCTPVILSPQSGKHFTGQYHLICPDMEGIAHSLKKSFEEADRERIAIYGANQTADLDKDRTEIFLELVSDGQSVFRNTGNLEYCFRSFLPKAGSCDGVICVNGYAAISLAKKLEKENPKLLEKMVIVSCEEVLGRSKYNHWIYPIDMKLETYGQTAYYVMELAEQNEQIGSMIIKMKGIVCELPKKPEVHENVSAVEEFHEQDPEIASMEKIEQLLRDADDMDHHIIAMLLSDAKYSEISDSCYMTEGNVKYRVKKYMGICGCKTKKELLELLREYLQ